MLLQGGLGALPPVIVSKVLDEGVAGIPNEQAFYLLTAAVIILELLGYLFYYVNHRLLARVIADINRNLSTDAFAASMRQEWLFMTCSVWKNCLAHHNDTRDFSTLITLTMDVANNLVQSIVTAFILLTAEWHLALLFFLTVPVFILFVSLYRNLARRVSRQGMRAMANVNATIKETISGIAIAKNFRQEESIYAEFKRSIPSLTGQTSSAEWSFPQFSDYPRVWRASNRPAGLFRRYFSHSGHHHRRSLVPLYPEHRAISAANPQHHFILDAGSDGLSAAERILALIDAEHTVIQTGAYEPEKYRGKIDFNKLRFSYSNGKPPEQLYPAHPRRRKYCHCGTYRRWKDLHRRLIARFYEFQSGSC